ncbi:MAG: DNA polymerase III subunit gamma/tau [Burkholderiaceae bacterium]|nr:DNA polymerase III subunit gamma/tau [Burkholderiaceae bacterium]
MSYLVLARKYRPRRFAEMVGQEHVVQALGNALTQQRLHHAYLFTGTRGVGKTTVSRILAKSLNCTGADGQGGITAEPCGVCAACRDIDAGRYVDYVELDAASNRGVDEISQLLDQAIYKPVVGRFKVYMIDEVHMLTTTAFNAMLKTLEEPPEYLKFVLATTDPQKVPVTVLSRCLQFNLRPMAPQTVFEHLGQVLAAESIDAEPGALRLLARAARGSMRDALSLTDQAIAFGAGRLEEGAIRQMLGAVDRSHAARIVEAMAAADGVALVRAADELRALGLSASGTLEELATLAQQMAVLQAVPAAADEADPDHALLQRLAGLLAPDETQLLYSVALHGRAELALAPDEYSGLVMVLLRLLAFKPYGPADGANAGAGAGAAARAAAAPSARSAAPQSAAMPAVAPARSEPSAPSPAAATPAPASPELRRPAALPRSSVPLAQAVPDPEPSPPAEARTFASQAAEGLRTPPATAPASSAPMPRAEPVSSPAGRIGPTEAAASSAPRGSSLPPWEIDEDSLLGEPAAASAARPVSAAPASAAPVNVAVAPRAVPQAARPIELPDLGVGSAVGADGPDAAERACTDRWLACCAQWFEQGGLFGLVRELAWQAQCIGIDASAEPPCWTLRVERESLRQSSHRERLQEALAERLGHPVRLEIVAGAVTDSAARRDAADRARAQAQAEAVIRQDPQVLELLARFPGARIVPGSIRPA